MEVTDHRSWDELHPDALGLIFKNLTLQEMLTVVPRVCKSWRKTINGPYCWQEIDIEEWSNQSSAINVDRMVRMLIARSGSLHKLCVSGLQTEPIFSFIAEHASSLRYLRLSRSIINDTMMEQFVDSLAKITFLDISYCGRIGARALEAIGKQCKSLTGLRRNMHPLDIENKLSQNDEAHAIATTMPKLKHLEMAYLLVDTTHASEIISKCSELEFLDLRGCWEVELDDKYVKSKFPKLKILGPQVVDHFEKNDFDEFSDYSDDSLYDYESSDGMWDDEERFEGLEGLEFRFYNGFDEENVHGWPPSP